MTPAIPVVAVVCVTRLEIVFLRGLLESLPETRATKIATEVIRQLEERSDLIGSPVGGDDQLPNIPLETDAIPLLQRAFGQLPPGMRGSGTRISSLFSRMESRRTASAGLIELTPEVRS